MKHINQELLKFLKLISRKEVENNAKAREIIRQLKKQLVTNQDVVNKRDYYQSYIDKNSMLIA